MKILFGAFVTAGSGSSGGTTASRNRQGSYFKNKPNPTNPNTVAQQAARAILTAFAQAWRSLTQIQRDSWTAAAPNFVGTIVFGNPTSPTGNNLYTRLNSVLASVGLSSISVPPLPTQVPYPQLSQVVIALGAGTYDVTYVDPTASFTTQVWATAPKSAGVNNPSGSYRQIDAVTGGGGPTYDATAAYNAKFGVPPVGTKVFFQMVNVHNASGQISGVSTGSAIVAA
jgi:hypothetical protein